MAKKGRWAWAGGDGSVDRYRCMRCGASVNTPKGEKPPKCRCFNVAPVALPSQNAGQTTH